MASIAASPLDRLYDLVTSSIDISDEDIVLDEHIPNDEDIAKQVSNILAENKGLDLEHRFTDKENTLLMAAAEQYKIETIKVLIDNGAKVNAVNKNGATALYYAVYYSYFRKADLVEYLINKGAKVNVKDKDGNTPLHWATRNNIAIPRLLIKAGAEVNAVNEGGSMPLHWAASYGKNIVEFLLDNGAKVDAVDKVGNTPLHYAAGRDEKIVQLLIDKKVDVNAVNERGKTPLYEALNYRKLKAAKLLIENNADWKKYGKSLLIETVHRGDLELVKFFLEKGVKVNSKTKSRRETPLHIAAEQGNLEIAEYLINKGAKVNAKNNDRETPLHIAAEWGNEDIARLLINKRAKVNAKNNDRETPLHIAARRNDLPLATYLVEEAGADVNIANDEGNLFWSLATDEAVRRSLIELYFAYRFLFLSRKLGGRPAGVALGLLKY